MENSIRTINIGSAAGNDVVITNTGISRSHAQITVRNDGSVMIRDLGSTNGTYVNGNRITAPVSLHPGDSVVLGNTGFDWAAAARTGGTKVAGGMPGEVPADATRVITVGRGANNNVKIDDPRVSTNHCKLVVHRDGTVSIIDHSSNGTFVGGQRVPGSFRLTHGDRVMLANAIELNWERLLRPRPQQPAAGGTMPAQKVNINSGNIPVKPEPVKKKSHTGLWIGIAAAVAVLLGVAVFFMMSGAKTDREKMSPSDIYAQYDKSVVIIGQIGYYEVTFMGRPVGDYADELAQFNKLSIDDEGDLTDDPAVWFGTGFYVSEDGKIMTNHHVVDPAGDQNTKYDGDKIANYLREQLRRATDYSGDTSYRQIADGLEVNYVAEWFGVVPNGTRFDPNNISDYTKCELLARSDNDKVDLGLIQTLNRKTPEDAAVVDVLNYSDPEHRRIGDKIYTIGFPTGFMVGSTDAGLQANHQGGEITQDRGTFEYGHNIKVTSGASGSPVFDEYGQFAGVIYAVFGDGSNGYNLAVMPEQAAKFYKKNIE